MSDINFWFWCFIILFSRFVIYPGAREEAERLLHKRTVRRLIKETERASRR